MSKFQLEVEKLRARFEEMAHALLCVGPADLSITSRTLKTGYSHQQPEVLTKLKQWLRDDLALHADSERLSILAEPVLVLDEIEDGSGRLTILAVTMPWATLQRQPDTREGTETAVAKQRAALDDMTREAAADGSYAEVTRFVRTR